MPRTLRRAVSAGAVLAIVVASVAVAAPAQALPGLWTDTTVSPAADTVTPSSSVTFNWSPRSGYTGNYKLTWIGTAGTGSTEVSGTSATVSLADGNYSWYVGYRAGSLIKYWAETSLQSLTVDSSAPVVTLTTPTDGTVTGANLPFLVAGTIADPTFDYATLAVDGNVVKTLGSKLIVETIATSGLANGAHVISVTAYDDLGRQTTAVRNVVVDKAAPVATFSSPVDGSYLAPGAALAVAATLSDASSVTSWTLSVDDVAVANGSGVNVTGTVPTASWGDATIHELVVSARDQWGNQGSTAVSVVADAKKPRLAITSPTVNSVVGASVDVAGTASDTGSGLSSVGVDVRRINGAGGCGQVLVGGAAAIAGGAWTVDGLSLSGIADGDYCLRAEAADAVGNTSGERLLPITIDQTAPSVPTGLAPSGWVTTADSVSWGASSDPHGVHYDWVLLPDWTDVVQSGSTDTTSTVFDEPLAPGGYAFEVTARDDLGNTSSVARVEFDVVGIPQFLAPADGTAFARQLEAEWSGVNAPGGVRRYEVEATHVETDAIETFTVNDGTTLLSRNFGAAFAEGEWTLRVRAVYEDRIGVPLNRVGPWSPSITLVHDLTGPVAPALLTPGDGTSLNTDDFDFSWSAPSDAVSYVFRYNNTGETNDAGRLTGDRQETEEPRLSGEGIYDGPFWWQVRAVDALGNAGPWSAIHTVTVDRAAPAAVTLRALANGTAVVGKSATFSWFAPEPGLDYEFELATSSVLGDNGSLAGAVSAPVAALQTVASDMPAGVYFWHVRAIDAAGNVGPWSGVWSLTMRAPAAAVTTFSASGGGTAQPTESNAQPTVTGDTDDAEDAPDDAGSGGSASESSESEEPSAVAETEADTADNAEAAADEFPIGWLIGALVLLLVVAGTVVGIRFARR